MMSEDEEKDQGVNFSPLDEFLKKPMTRRKAISQGTSLALGLVVGGIVAGSTGYLTGRSQAPSTTQTVTSTVTKVSTTTPLKVAMVIPFTSKDDNGWGQLHYTALQRIRDKYGAVIAVTDKVQFADEDRAVRDYAAAGYDIVLGTSFELIDSMIKVENDFQKTTFVDYPALKAGNRAIGVDLKEEEAAYLAGVIAGNMTKSKTIGAVIGFDYPTVVRTVEGLKAGAKSVDSGTNVRIVYLGNWGDPDKGKAAANALIDVGADVIYQYADLSGLGAIEAAKARNTQIIGSSLDQHDLAPQLMLTSVLFRYDTIAETSVGDLVEGKLQQGTWNRWGLKENVVGLAPYYGNVPADVAKKVDQAKQDIIAGKIQVPLITKPPA